MSSGDPSVRRLRLIERVLHLADDRLAQLERFLDTPVAAAPTPPAPSLSRDWPHAPLHRISKQGTYIVTAGIYQKQHLFAGADRLDHLETALLHAAKEAGWHLEAWAVFSNHYHFVAHAQPDCLALAVWIAKLHYETSGAINALDQCAGRKVWFNYRDTELTYGARIWRLNYVHQNAVKHGLVRVANQYRWCSAAWFERTATPAQVRTIYRFKIDQDPDPGRFRAI